jgi:hypothetical protein
MDDRVASRHVLVLQAQVGREAATDVGRPVAQREEDVLVAVEELEVPAGSGIRRRRHGTPALAEAHSGELVEDGGAGVVDDRGERGRGSHGGKFSVRT